MAEAQRDENNVPTLIAASETNGTTPTVVYVDVSGGLLVDDSTTGTDHGGEVATRDQNFVPVLLAVSSVDGVTPVEVYADTEGKLLINSN